jgi:electron transport complex protein RnfD
MSGPAASLAARNVRFLLALAPGALAMCWLFPALPVRLALAAATALLLEAACLRLRRQPLPAFLAEGGALRAALLLALWLPTLALAPLLLAVAVAVLLGRQATGGLGATPVHGAMVGAALAQLGFGALPPALDAAAPWLALGWLAGGLALLAARQARWPVPLAFLAAAALAAWPHGGALSLLIGAPWLLAAGFVLAEPGSIGESLRTRVLLAAAAGAGAVLAGGSDARALPYALLAAGLLAPLLDAAGAARRAPTPAPSPSP